MEVSHIEGLVHLKFDPVFTAAIASLLFLLGVNLRHRFEFFRRYSIPSGVIGGLLAAAITFSLHTPEIASVEFSHSLQIPMIAVFFTRIGLTGSFRAFRRGGLALFLYLCCCWGLTLLQNVIGVVAAESFGLNPLLGIMAGAVSLEGGHNLAVVFGPMAESLGAEGALVVALASATFGVIVGGTLGAHVAHWLVRRHNLELTTDFELFKHGYHESEERQAITINDFIHTLGLLLMLMALGRWGADWLQHRARAVWGWNSFTFPGYLGAMLLAVAFRNLNDALRIVRIHPQCLDLISTVSVSIFLTVSMMSVRIGELYALALPLLAILILQTLVILLMTVFIIFPLMGKDYDAAIICAGFIGHGLGAPPSAVSMMRAACDQHNLVSYKAFLIVPLCGAALIDLFAIPNILWFMKFLAPSPGIF